MRLCNFLAASLLLILSACSSSSHDSVNGINDASADPVAKIEVVSSESPQSALESKYLDLQGPCDLTNNPSPTSMLHRGSEQTVRDDWAYIKGDGISHGSEHLTRTIVESIQDGSNFTTIETQSGHGYTVVGRMKNTLTATSEHSQSIEIISTDPPSLRDMIKKAMNERGDSENSVGCTGDDDGRSTTTEEVLVTLKNGNQYKAIRRTEIHNQKNYVCTETRRGDGAEISKKTIAAFTQDLDIGVVSEDFVNAFASCYNRHRIIENRVTYAATKSESGEYKPVGKPLMIDKKEVLEIK